MDLTGFFLDAFIAGVYLFVGAYHFQTWLRRREERPYLWLSLACLSALVVDLTGLGARFDLPMEDDLVVYFANQVAMVATCACLIEFVASFRRSPPPRALRVLEVAAFVPALGTPLRSTPLLVAGLLLCMALIAAAMGMAIRGLRAGVPEIGPVTTGFVLLGLGLIGDIFGQLRILPVPSGFLAIFGFLSLFLTMSIALSARFERTHRELDLLRRDLEARVAERTRAIEGANRRLRRYFPVSVIERILGADAEASPTTERRTVTILFSDLADFTAFSDGADPQTVTSLLNDYLRAMFEEIDARGGTVDKVMGDGIMATWGAAAQMPVEEQARQAVSAAVGMQRRLGLLSRDWAGAGLATFASRIGIHQDLVAVGNIGTENLWSFTAIGGGVNLASRLEGACEPGTILVSGAVHRHVAGLFPFGPRRRLALKGVRGETEAHPLDPAAAS